MTAEEYLVQKMLENEITIKELMDKCNELSRELEEYKIELDAFLTTVQPSFVNNDDVSARITFASIYKKYDRNFDRVAEFLGFKTGGDK